MLKELPKGIPKDEYRAKQTEKAKEDQSQYFNDSINKLNESIEALRLNIEDLRASTGVFLSHVSSELKEFKTQLDYVSHETKGRLGDISLELEGHKGRYKILEENHQDLQKQSNVADKEISYIWHEVERFEKSLAYYVDDVNRSRMAQDSRFDKKIQDLWTSFIDRPTGIPELRKDLESQIELNNLNGQNAVIRSSNSEKQIQIIEKKIEQIYLMLKRNKLDQGIQ